MSAGHGRIPNGIITESIGIPSAYIDTRHATYISTPQHACSAFHHDYRKVDARDPAPIVAPSPVATQDAMMSLAAIEHLDFEAEIPCDGSWCGELCQRAAFGVVVALCRGCRQGRRAFICRRCWSECQAVGWICPSCDRHCESRFILLVVTFR